MNRTNNAVVLMAILATAFIFMTAFTGCASMGGNNTIYLPYPADPEAQFEMMSDLKKRAQSGQIQKPELRPNDLAPTEVKVTGPSKVVAEIAAHYKPKK